MKYIDKEYEEEYEDIGFTKEEVIQTFCPNDKTIIRIIACRSETTKELCLKCWNREITD